jgi:4'-phosphopantetheinyl transferase
MNLLYFMEVEPLINGGILNEMIEYISGEKKERLLRSHIELDRKIGIYAEVLLRCLICMKSGVGYRDIEIKAGPRGKPYLLGYPNYEFNLSHTRNAIALALSELPVGVDIERIRDIDISIAKHIFSEKEQAWLHDGTGDQKFRFFSIWTKKEALLKYYGRGLSNDLKLFDVTGSFPREKFSAFRADDYIISICSCAEYQENDFIRISEPELIRMWRNFAN